MIVKLLEEFAIEATCGKAIVQIKATIDNADRVSVKFNNDRDHLKFKDSDKETVMAVALALQQAAELVDARKTSGVAAG